MVFSYCVLDSLEIKIFLLQGQFFGKHDLRAVIGDEFAGGWVESVAK